MRAIGPEGASELEFNRFIVTHGRTWRRQLNAARELPALVLEFVKLLTSPIFWSAGGGRGDNHSVMVIPGYGVSDWQMSTLRNWLRRLGCQPMLSGIRTNPGWSEELVEALGSKVKAEARRAGRRVTLIGHSLGGLQGRSVALRHPDSVRHLIALGAPFRFASGAVSQAVAITSLYTRFDLSFEPRAREPHAHNIEVQGTHGGLVINKRVYDLLAKFFCEPDLQR